MPASVKGGVELRKALKQFSPDLAKALPKEIAAALKPIVKTARGYLPDDSQVLSGWLARSGSTSKWQYDSKFVKSKVGYKTSPSKPNPKGFRSLARVFNKSKAGSIYEIMGKANPDSIFVQNQMAKYDKSMRGQGKLQGRALLAAYDENNGKARAAVLKALTDAANKLNKRARG